MTKKYATINKKRIPMKTRKNLMVLVLLSLFLSVGVADNVNLDDINLEELETLTGEDNSSSTEYEYGDGFDQATYDEFVKSEEEMAKIREHTAKTKAHTAKTKVETANKLEVAKVLEDYANAGNF